MSKTRKTTAHRPSQANQEFVTRSDGTKVRNTAYKGISTTVNSLMRDFSDDFGELDYYYSTAASDLPKQTQADEFLYMYNDAYDEYWDSNDMVQAVDYYASRYTSTKEDHRQYSKKLLEEFNRSDTSAGVVTESALDRADNILRAHPDMVLGDFIHCSSLDIEDDLDEAAFRLAAEHHYAHQYDEKVIRMT